MQEWYLYHISGAFKVHKIFTDIHIEKWEINEISHEPTTDSSPTGAYKTMEYAPSLVERVILIMSSDDKWHIKAVFAASLASEHLLL